MLKTYEHNRGALICIAVFLCIALTTACHSQRDTPADGAKELSALGFHEADVISIYPTRGGLVAEPTPCAATDSEPFLRLVEGLTQADAAPDMEQNAVSSLYRTLLFSGTPQIEGYLVGEIGGKAYVQRPDGSVCTLPDTEYAFMLDLCAIVRPYPEELDQRELVGAVKAMAALYQQGAIPSGITFDTRLPQNVNFMIPSVHTVDDFRLIDALPYSFSDVAPPAGQYVAVVPCGAYYELQMGVTKTDGVWRVDGAKVARSNLRMMQVPRSEDWRLVFFGPSITDISGWGMAQLGRVELFDVKTGEVLWQADGLCITGRSAWSEDGRYFAFSHEVGRARNRGLQVILLDTATMTAANLVSPDGKADSRLEVLAWASNSELTLDCTPKGQAHQTFIYHVPSSTLSAN